MPVNVTYAQLIAELQKAIKKSPTLKDELVCIYQTDNWARQVSHVQIGVGGNCLCATKDWQERK